jgi:hypothetical protein
MSNMQKANQAQSFQAKGLLRGLAGAGVVAAWVVMFGLPHSTGEEIPFHRVAEATLPVA